MVFGDVWAPFQAEAFAVLADALQSVCRGKRPTYRGLWLERTKGTSKDSDVGCGLLWLLLFSRVPLLVELGADKRDQAGETKKAMRIIVALNPWMKDRIEFQNTRILSPRTQVFCEFLSTDPTSSHGSRPNVTVCNELSHITTEDFAATMADNADKIGENLFIIATNAGFIGTWQWRWREGYRTDSDWWFQKVDIPAPWIPDRNVTSAKRRNSSKRYSRLWQGIWSTPEGDAIDPDDVARATVLTGPLDPTMAERDDWWVVGGVDAGTKHDHAAFVLVGFQFQKTTMRLARCQSWAPEEEDGRVDLGKLKRAIIQAQMDFGFRLLQVNYDPHEMHLMVQQLVEAGIPMAEKRFTEKNCDQMATDILHTFRGRELQLYEDRELMLDLAKLQIIEKKWGYKLDAPKDTLGHADRAISLAIALPSALAYREMAPPPTEEPGEHRIEV